MKKMSSRIQRVLVVSIFAYTLLYLFLMNGIHVTETEREEDFRRMVEYLIAHGVPVDATDKLQKPPKDYVEERMKEIYDNILEKTGQDRGGRKDEPKPNPNEEPSSLPEKSGTNIEAGKLSQKQKQEVNSEPKTIEEMANVPLGKGQSQVQGKPIDKEGQKQLEDDMKGTEGGDNKNDPEICESCEEEPVRFQLQPCGHFLCADCIPKRKQKKKICATCGENAQEVTEIGH